MVDQTRSPKTAAALGDAMEVAIAAGDLEVAERLFESYRRLFAEYQEYELASCVGSLGARPVLPGH